MNTMPHNSEECLELLHLIGQNSSISQRELAIKSGLSLGKVNYCLKALINVGYLKMQNFKNSDRKFNYVYIITPKGFVEKTLIAKNFLIKKQQEYDKIKSYLSN